ncbi:MAG: DUF4450 domain-containing protein [Paludibacter sp.]|nr:DUF4450 domain-containing protein [Paludibacter sp.]
MRYQILKQLTALLLISGCSYSHAQNQPSKVQVYDPELNQLVDKKTVNKDRELRYRPEGDDFVIVNGTSQFNRALYGTHTGFRVETGDVPEFALYLPRMGGNLSFSIENKQKSIQLNAAQRIECRYRAGSRIYYITDPLLGKGKITITALAMSEAEGMMLKIETQNIPTNTKLSWVFGGAADKRFSREGDMGVDPIDCFELKPEYCKGNEYQLFNNSFQLTFGAKHDRKLIGTFPPKSELLVTTGNTPVLKGKLPVSNNNTYYLAIQIPDAGNQLPYTSLCTIFEKSEAARVKLASTLKIETPDPYFNTLGGTLAMAADGIWSGETWLHGAVGWRMPLSGWRAGYTGDALGWHDRSRLHFDAYAASQVTNVEPVYPHPNQDTTLNMARAVKQWGTQMYSNGYICRNPHENNKMHHYDMNLCYIDELLWHLNWTGDLAYAQKIWPVIASDLAWEKRNFDPDNDGLYDAYCCIWASDGLYYNSGAVTHSSAYNYRANKMAAEIAQRIGKDPKPYANEADKILKALNARLWITPKGHWAEFQDFMGEKKVHESAALWTIYHAIDSETADPFQGYQATRYVDTEIPHFPVVAKGLKDEGYATLSTTNWMPYCWSTNNVVFAEVLHTALSYWEAGRNEEGYKLLKSSVLDGMYLGGSPGNVGQISSYDAARGESYRDFGDPIGVMSRALVQGLFGIIPDAMNDRLILRPGFPQSWDHASISTSDIDFSFKQKAKTDIYTIKPHFQKKLAVELQIKAYSDSISTILINGKPTGWKLMESAAGNPVISISIPEPGTVEIVWTGKRIEKTVPEVALASGALWQYESASDILKIFDPQQVISQTKQTGNTLSGKISGATGHRTLFLQLKQGQMTWWQPVNIEITAKKGVELKAFSEVNAATCEGINIDKFFNDSVSHIFENKYLSPRSPYTTLQIPIQGIGEWCHPTESEKIDDSGLRKVILNNTLSTKLNVSFRSPAVGKNIVFTSLWDNFPKKIEIPLNGSASHAYLLMAGTTNQMQTHFVNGRIHVEYTDGTRDTLELKNPENWCPIEQDYYNDGKAFKLDSPRPYRIHLLSGLVSNDLEKDLKIEGVYGRKIKGGAGVLLDMPLNKDKKLRKLELETVANEVIIGLMSLTLQR